MGAGIQQPSIAQAAAARVSHRRRGRPPAADSRQSGSSQAGGSTNGLGKANRGDWMTSSGVRLLGAAALARGMRPAGCCSSLIRWFLSVRWVSMRSSCPRTDSHGCAFEAISAEFHPWARRQSLTRISRFCSCEMSRRLHALRPEGRGRLPTIASARGARPTGLLRGERRAQPPSRS